MKLSVPVLFATSALVLAACGGGGSAPGGGPPPTLRPTATPTPTPTPSTTTAQGTLVDDPSNTPLSGVKVQLDPWIAYATPGPTPTPIAVSTTDAQGHFTVSAPNGTYLLVIGDDDPTYPSGRPTIHDRIVLAAQTTLKAPTLPAWASVTPPPMETNGDYRLVTIDSATEVPCINDYDQQRTNLGLAHPVVDEWLTENVRGEIKALANGVGTSSSYLTLANETATAGSPGDCSMMMTGSNGIFVGTSQKQYSENIGQLWFAARWDTTVGPGNPQGNGAGAAEFPLDPRVNDNTTGGFPQWP